MSDDGRMNFDEFADFVEDKDETYELIDGQVERMPDPSDQWGALADQTLGALVQALQKAQNEHDSIYHLVIQAGYAIDHQTWLCTDFAICDEPAEDDEPNPPPLALIELATSETYDRTCGRRHLDFRMMESCQTLLILHANYKLATLWQRDGKRWIVEDVVGTDSDLPILPGLSLSMSDIYGESEPKTVH